MTKVLQEDSNAISSFDETDILLGLGNVSDPHDLVRFPGFGFWPLWYLETFREKAYNLSTSKTEERKVSSLLMYSIRVDSH